MVINKVSGIILIICMQFLLASCNNGNRKAGPEKDQESQSMLDDKLRLLRRPSFKVEGIYTAVNESSDAAACKMTLTIKKADEGFTYNLKTESRLLEGNVSLEVNDNRDGYFITLEGIRWSENEGVISSDEEGSQTMEPLEIPVGILGSFSENLVSIQNYGNSMNYFIQLGECDKKFIELKKQ